MTEEIVKFDPEQFAKQLKEKIQLDIAKFLPEDVWFQKIREEVKNFLEGHTEDRVSYGSGRAYVPSGLSVVVNQILKAETEARCRAYLSEFKSFGPTISGHVDALIEHNMEAIVRGAISPVLQKLFNDV